MESDDSYYSEMGKIVNRHFPLSDEMCLPNCTYDFQNQGMPYLGHKHHLDYLYTVLLNNSYGAFLVTGFRGVGKTTLVQSAINMLNTQLPSKVIAINVNLSTERNYIDILFEISRKLHDEVKKSDIWGCLSRSERARIELINRRTLMEIKYSQQTGSEISAGFGRNNNPQTFSVSLGSKLSHNISEENTLRNLTVSDIETEFSDIVKSIKRIMPESRIIIVLDEIDKLTQDKNGMNCFEEVLRQAKGIITGINSIFIFIAGVDIYEKWEQDNNRVESLYDSLFTWQLYLPCVWDTAADLFDLFQEKHLVYKPVEEEFKELVKNETIRVLQGPFQILNQYLIFMGKGLPRKILRLFDGFVKRTSKTPYFQLTKSDYQKICTLKELYKKFYQYQRESKFKSEIDRDTHYIVFLTMLDYLLQMEEDFTAEDLTTSILSENNVGTLRLNAVFAELFDAFQKYYINIIVRTDIGKYKISNKTLQYMMKGITFETTIPNGTTDDNTTDVDLPLQNQIKNANIPEITQFWGRFQAKKILYKSEELFLMHVIKEGTSYIASIYGLQNKKNQKRRSEGKFLSAKDYESKYLPQMECIVVDNALFSTVQCPTSGCVLSELVTAKLERKTANSIVLQLLSFSLEMKKETFVNLPLSPENIMVCPDGLIKILNPVSVFLPTEEKNRYTYSVFRAPETEPDKKGRTIVYSIGMIMLYLLSPQTFSHNINADILETERLIDSASCSSMQKKLIAQMVQYDIQNRPELDEKLIKRVKHCPGFWGCDNHPSGKPEKVVLRFYESGEEEPVYSPEDKEEDALDRTVANIDQTLPDLLPANDNTVIKHDAGIVWPLKGQETAGGDILIIPEVAYLENRDTDERIPITVSPFIVGRNPKCNYRVRDSLASRRHFRIEYKEDDFYLHSEGARNGIIINGEKKEGEFVHLLMDNTAIRIGNTELIFRRKANDNLIA